MLSSLPANRALVVSFWVKENLRFSGMGCLTGSVLRCHIHFSSKMNQDHYLISYSSGQSKSALLPNQSIAHVVLVAINVDDILGYYLKTK